MKIFKKLTVTKNTKTVIDTATEFSNTVSRIAEENAKLAANRVTEAIKNASANVVKSNNTTNNTNNNSKK